MKLDGHISRRFNQDLETLRSITLEMGGIVERQLHNAIKSLDQNNSSLAAEVAEGDKRVNELELQIEEMCTHIIVKRQPAAGDLRMVLAVSRIVRDLERMGDEAVKIAKQGIVLTELGGSPIGHVEARELADLVRRMLNLSLDAFARHDGLLAREVIARDDDVDEKYARALTEFTDYMSNHANSVKKVINVIWTIRSLERVGDHAKNICGHIVYILEGAHLKT